MLCDAVFPAASIAVAAIVGRPLAVFGTVQVHDQGDVVSVHTVTLFTVKTTRATAMLSLAVAAIETLVFLRTVAPSAGDVILTVGATESPGGGGGGSCTVTEVAPPLPSCAASPAYEAAIGCIPAVVPE
jgi:hypothetical protein